MIENVRLEVSIYLATISDVALMLAKDASSYLLSYIAISAYSSTIRSPIKSPARAKTIT